tara:strand:- start:333 stop:1091 length:759 start_codon:yes stop_codon:yes gene_type:complete
MKYVAVSGGFDPVHIGHLRMFCRAKNLGDKLIVILNSDNFLLEKKGHIFMPFDERKELILGFSYVDEVVSSIDNDNTVCKTILSLKRDNKIDIFANGGDRKNEEDIPEFSVCNENNIEMIFGIGGDKIQSSSSLTNKYKNYVENRPWGSFENIYDPSFAKVKKICVNPNESLSLQYHKKRSEHWIVIKGKATVLKGKEKSILEKGNHIFIPQEVEHRLSNETSEIVELIEVQVGEYFGEDDIVRIEDKYLRK